ncbi:DNA/RNA non-specific endonuclease (plasmid) [Thiospirochaeta perfilievii]|uniref:Endonuclease n=1 Tax=Thiospirochaeta perfilievii TaxID=252967 RepID=A0A5C1QH72_9SPIO|nr:DNA/RNA non-specific endonuclease [Thiospirochaeta perfilievii]QEN06439.1 DNA/RNA non-specific endonuclease [Thiospirochaeta perfilievii]
MRKIILVLILFIFFNLFAQLEIPEITKSTAVITRDNYTLQYNEQHEQADWVAYELLKSEIINDIDRTDNFREDPLVKTGSASLSDYKGSGYDRGHLAPAADMKLNKDSMSDSFYMSNMSPQLPSLNRGRWKNLEELVRSWVYVYGAAYIVTGPILNRNDFPSIGPNKVSIPDYYYKAILLFKNNQWQVIGFVLPNIEGKNKYALQTYIYSIDELEQLLGFDLYPSLEDSIENMIEANVNLDLWSFNITSFPKTYIDQEQTSNISETYWINSNSMTRHNSSCKYYNNTKSGYFTDKEEGKPCSTCGG